MNIYGKRIILRALEESDLDKLHVWSNDPILWKGLGGWHFPYSKHSTKKWLELESQNTLDQRFAIDDSELGMIGIANLLNIDWKNKNAFHGMLLGSIDARGKGIGLDVVMTIMRYAFHELGLNRLDGSMIEYNDASLSLYCQKCNWQIEGRQRNWYFRDGRFWDRILVGVTKEDYFDLISMKNYWV